ncbi:hypothetical protein L1887_53657 [Cichorium endivia]|nr:hypothetical protein L1887_53657 [Cichorium endivia]
MLWSGNWDRMRVQASSSSAWSAQRGRHWAVKLSLQLTHLLASAFRLGCAGLAQSLPALARLWISCGLKARQQSGKTTQCSDARRPPWPTPLPLAVRSVLALVLALGPLRPSGLAPLGLITTSRFSLRALAIPYTIPSATANPPHLGSSLLIAKRLSSTLLVLAPAAIVVTATVATATVTLAAPSL